MQLSFETAVTVSMSHGFKLFDPAESRVRFPLPTSLIAAADGGYSALCGIARRRLMEIVGLDRSQLRKAADVAAAAFYAYPMFALVFPDPRRRTRYLSWYLRNVLNCALRYGEVYTTPDIRGVAFALPPGHTRISIWEYIRSGFLPTPLVLGIRDYSRSMKYLALAEHIQEELTRNRPHYYLWGLAVEPSQQRQGIGEALLTSVLAKADALSVPVYLETHVRNNVRYYQKRGFDLVRAVDPQEHEFPIWCMLREPTEGTPKV